MDRIRRVKARWKKKQRQWKRGGGNESIKNLSSVRCPNRWRGEDGGGGEVVRVNYEQPIILRLKLITRSAEDKSMA